MNKWYKMPKIYIMAVNYRWGWWNADEWGLDAVFYSNSMFQESRIWDIMSSWIRTNSKKIEKNQFFSKQILKVGQIVFVWFELWTADEKLIHNFAKNNICGKENYLSNFFENMIELGASSGIFSRIKGIFHPSHHPKITRWIVISVQTSKKNYGM